MGSRNRFVAVAAVLVLVAGGCTPARRERAAPGDGPAPGGGGAPGAAAWRDCADEVRRELQRGPANMSYHCTTIKVPRDWAAGSSPGPDGVRIALLRARVAGQRDRIGSLVVNPGGPGGSGVQLAMYLSLGLPSEVTRRFDIVGFDPRGVGRSTPIKCPSDELLDRSFGAEPDPAGQADFDAAVTIAREIGQVCGAKYGDDLPLFATEQAARDMEAVRVALGDSKLTYLGYSYGTLLGATYAHLFPGSVRALVLDGAIDPGQDLIESSESQAQGFERAYGSFADWCAGHARECVIAPDARGTIAGLLDAARRAPVRGTDGRSATPGWIFTAIVSSLYSRSDWADLAEAADDLRGGDAEGIFAMADAYADRDSSGHYSNLFDANTTVNCGDSEERPSLAQVRDLQSRWRDRYPTFGAPLAVGLLTCALWPGKRDPYPTGAAQGAPPIVVVGTVGDPATPYEQTPKLADLLGTGVVLTWRGEGHTAYPETRCITDAVNAYLIQLKPPREGTTCPAG